MLLHLEFEHDYELYDSCAMSYDDEIEECLPDDMQILQAYFECNTVFFNA